MDKEKLNKEKLDKEKIDKEDIDKEIKKITSDSSGISASEANEKLARKYTEDAKKVKKKNKNTVYNILIVIFAAIFLFSAGYLGLYYYKSYKSEKNFDKLRDLVEEPDFDENNIPEDLPEDVIVEKTDENNQPLEKPRLFVYIDGKKVQYKYKELYSKNHDFIGWLKIDGTKINYPVMLTPDDEEYYIHRDYNKDWNDSGTPFVDTDSNVVKPSDNVIIYGHHMKSKTMFYDLGYYEEEDFYKKHKYIEFNTIYGDHKYEVIAAFKTKIKDKDDTSFKYYTFFNAADKEEFDYFVENIKDLTTYEIPTTAEYGDKLLTLSTCYSHTENGRFVVVAKRIE